MTTLGALSQAWTSAEASLPLGWQLTGLMRFGVTLAGWKLADRGWSYVDPRSPNPGSRDSLVCAKT